MNREASPSQVPSPCNSTHLPRQVEDGERGVAQFFFEIGYGACFAEAYIRNSANVPWAMSDAEVERAWEIAGEAHDDPEEFDRYLALAALSTPIVRDTVDGSGTETATHIIARIVAISNAIGSQAGVGGMETAGGIISYLHEHPEDLPKLIDGSLSVLDWPSGWHAHGCLSWHGNDGEIHYPAGRIEQ